MVWHHGNASTRPVFEARLEIQLVNVGSGDVVVCVSETLREHLGHALREHLGHFTAYLLNEVISGINKVQQSSAAFHSLF